MPHGFTNEEWAEYTAFDFTANCCLRNSFHYSATVPPHYTEYRRLIANGIASSPFHWATCPKGPLRKTPQPPVCQGHSSLDAPSELNLPQKIPSLFGTLLVPQAEG